MSESRESTKLDGERDSEQRTCLTCNKKTSNEILKCCSSCKKDVHMECSKVISDLIVCGQCSGKTKPPPLPPKSVRSTASSSAKKRELMLKCLEEEKALRLKELAIEKEFLEKKYNLLEQQIASDDESDGRSKSSGYLNNWIEDVQSRNQTMPQRTLNPSAPIFEVPGVNHQDQVPQLHPKRCHQFTQEELGQEAVGNPDIDYAQIETMVELTKTQINARKIVFELPKFYGKPKEWPHFISSFEESTKLCGFKNFENIARLRHSLKGIAFDSVWPQLTMNGDVSVIIATLKTLFGRPELIIKELVSEIHSAKPIKDENLLSIMNLAMAVQNLVATINSCELLAYMNNPSLLDALVEKLSPSLKLQWGMRCSQSVIVNLAVFNIWIQEVSLSARMVTNEVPKQLQSETRTEKKGSTGGSRLFLNVHSEPDNDKATSNCLACGMKCEYIRDCETFRDLTLKRKWEIVNSNQLCRTCLEPRHKRLCPKETACGIDGCHFKHNPLLHKTATYGDSNTQGNLVAIQINRELANSVYFKVVPVRLHGPNSTIETFAFLDDGSGLTLIDQEITDYLEIQGVKQPLCITWTGNQSRLEKESQLVSVGISPLNDDKMYNMTNVRTVHKLALPCQSLSKEFINSFEHLRDLPILPYSSAKPQLLIGLKHMQLSIPLKTFEGQQDEPVCFSTRLGYVVFGSGSPGKTNGSHSINVHECDCELHRLVSTFFSLENIGVTASERALIPADEKRAIRILEETTKKVGDRYETGLLWRFDDVKLPDNLSMARKRLHCLQRKLDNNETLRSFMNEQILDHSAKGYIRKLTEDEAITRNERTWYLPIFPVINPNKPNKIRIVWDAAAKYNGVSLNSMLITGPDQLSSLVGVLQRFRLHKFAICGDIQQMFHQVRIRKEDQDSQRFLWVDCSGKEVTYVMQAMSFGACCSPSCAQYIKNLNAERYTNIHPRAVIGITKNHYVDDFLDGMSSEAELVTLAKDVKRIHASGGFLIRNWVSNSQTVLAHLQAQSKETETEKNLNICTEIKTEKVLGLLWSTKEDVFKYRLKITEHNRDILTGKIAPTKRQLLSTIMQIFDPLGFLANIMISVKLILQEVWKSRVEWDEQIKEEQFMKWKEWLLLISTIENIEIPRWHFKSASPENLQLHVFVDGSLLAYSAVAFFRFQEQDIPYCSLIAAKGKVASMKLTSVPRIELMGALMGARLAKSIQAEHFSLTITQRFFWCDSVTVLKWIHNDQLKFKQFVGFRIGEILELCDPSEWRYVPSKLNVADQATKTTKNSRLETSSEWFNGPTFLYEAEEDWPENIVKTSDFVELREVFAHSEHPIPDLVQFERYSSWKKLCRAVAWVFKAVSIWKVHKESRLNSPKILTASELQAAERFIIIQCQYEAFTDEMIVLSRVKEGQNNLKLEKTSPLYKESPYVDEHGIARRRGRIDAAAAPFDVKRPILLPKTHALTYLVIRHYHEIYQHANDETVINEILQKYAIPSIRVHLKTVKLRCQKCKNKRAVPEPPLMAELPPARLQSFVRPFSYVGADYFGPIMVTVRRKPEKRWVMLLTCLSVRAIHMEVATSLTADSCIMCVNRFIARRGTPIEFISDNGSNLKGAANELKAFLDSEDNQLKFQNKFTTSTMKWKFITPGAPHMGGCWERLIRSVKTTLSQIMPISNPSEELLHTMLLEVEAVVNSRPLTFVGVENQTQEALTPNHFLLGTSSGSKPIGNLPEFYEEHTVLRKQWMTSQQLANQFWIRWVREYLPKLSKRTKWYDSTRQIEVGDVVILLDEQTARCTWPKGIVVRTIPSNADNQIRSAVVRTQSGEYTRPVTKMAVLDVTGKDPDKHDHLRGEVLTTERGIEDPIPSPTPSH